MSYNQINYLQYKFLHFLCRIFIIIIGKIISNIFYLFEKKYEFSLNFFLRGINVQEIINN